MLGSLELGNINCAESQDNEPVEIVDKLFLGSSYASYNREALIRHNVKYIVNCSSNDNIYGHEFVYLHVHVKDKEGYNFLSSLYYSLDFIAEGLQKGSVFVFCSGGRSRSVSTIAAFLMAFYKMSFNESLQLLYRKRPQMKINNSFLLQLRLYYECDCNIHLASQLFLLYELSFLHRRLSTKSRNILQQYQSIVPASIELCLPKQDVQHLSLPSYIAKQFYCSHCNCSIFCYHNLLDHTSINFKEAEAILVSIFNHQNCVYPLHCTPTILGDSNFTKSFINRETVSNQQEDDLRMDISKLKLPVQSFQTSLEDVDLSEDDLSMIPEYLSTLSNVPITNDSLSLDMSCLIPLPTLSVVETSTTEQNQRCVSSLFHSITLTGTDTLLSNNQGSLSSPGSVCTSRKNSHCETNILHVAEDNFTCCAKDGIVVPNRIHKKRSIFDDDDDDEVLDSFVCDVKNKLQSVSVVQSEKEVFSPSPPLLFAESDGMSDRVFDRRVRLIPQDSIVYGKEKNVICDKYYVEPLVWMIKQCLEQGSDSGCLRCPNPECGRVIGGYSFLSDHLCSCGYSPFTNFYIYRNCTK